MPVPKGYKHRKLASAKLCAAGSFRRVKRNGVLVTVCCPKGKWWKGKSCRGGMKAIGLDVRRFGASGRGKPVSSDDSTTAYRRYLITRDLRGQFHVSRDGVHVYTAPSLKAAKDAVDTIAED